MTSQADLRQSAKIFTSSTMSIDPAWIDFNGHLNMAYYNVLFDACVDQAFASFGLGETYLKSRNASTFTVNAHVAYVHEVASTDQLEVDLRVLDWDPKRIHSFQTMRKAGTEEIMATSENMVVHMDMTTRRVAPFPDDIQKTLDRIWKANAIMPNDKRVGHVNGIRRKRT